MWNIMWLVQRLTWMDALDIFLVANLFFWTFYALKGTRAVPLVRGVTALLVTLALLTRLLPLRAFTWLVGELFPALVVAIPVLFQPELRRALEQLGRSPSLLALHTDGEDLEHTIAAVLSAVSFMAPRHVGALIVFERQIGLQEYLETGVYLDAEASAELFTTLFDHHTILHDGAVIIRHGRVAAAACVMPLTATILADRELGLRHRAALGISEESDAIAVVVSEERGSVSLTHNGRIIRDLDSKRLEALLRAFLLPSEPRHARMRLPKKALSFFRKGKK